MTIEQSDGACTPSFSSDGLERLACPKCSNSLRVEWGLVATGPARVAGGMLKIGATNAPHLICDECGFAEVGVRSNVKVIGEDRETVRKDKNDRSRHHR